MRSLVALLALAVAEVAAAASRPHVSFSFINSPLVPRDALQLLQPPSRAPTQMSAAVGLDAGSLLGQIVALPFRLLIKFGALLGSLVPDRLPSFWTVRAPALTRADARFRRSRARARPPRTPSRASARAPCVARRCPRRAST